MSWMKDLGPRFSMSEQLRVDPCAGAALGAKHA